MEQTTLLLNNIKPGDPGAKKSLNIYKIIGLVIIFLTIAMLWLEWAAKLLKPEDFALEEDYSQEECNVAGITLYGYLTTYQIENNCTDEEDKELQTSASDYTQYLIEKSANDPTLKAIVIDIDSWGGYPVAGEEIARALKEVNKPTIALIRGAGTSGAYWAATGADTIFASANSEVGGIGVTMSYLDNVEKNKKEGYTLQEIRAGEFKDYGDPDKVLTKAERELFLRDAKIVHENFIQAVVGNRGMEEAKVRASADGSGMLGQLALERGLIDAIGSIYEVKDYVKDLIGEEVNICWQ